LDAVLQRSCCVVPNMCSALLPTVICYFEGKIG
jgi:hypothetical protein